MSTPSTTPDALSRAATESIDSMFVPFGGSSSTETYHSPASSLRWSWVVCSSCGRIEATSARSRSMATKATRGSRCSSTAERMAAICAGPVPQQPPTIRAPRLLACAVNSAK